LGMAPLVSIVMPSLDQARFLPEALDSILGQDYANLEVVVADGGSQDATPEILAARAAADRRLRWFSEADSGPAQALNRAIGRARGTILGWLNADDRYAPGAIGRTTAALAAHPDWLMVYGQGEHIDAAGQPLGRYPTLPPEEPIERFADSCFICQPTVFFRRTVPLLLGPLDETLKASFDFDYWLRAFRAFPERIGFIDVVQAHSRLHPDAITARQRRTVALEALRILAAAFGTAPVHWLTSYLEEVARAPAGPADLDAHLLATLDEAAPYLAPADIAAMRQSLSRGGAHAG